MLVLTRKLHEAIHIGDATVRVTHISASAVKLGIDAPQSTLIRREELKDPRPPKPLEPRVGWNWWRGRGNSMHASGDRVTTERTWVVLVWVVADYGTEKAGFYATSATWKEPLPVSSMGGTWLGEVAPP